jgi:uncharacterized protein YyaL (SSP411 family)
VQFIRDHLYYERSGLLHSVYTSRSDAAKVEQIPNPIKAFVDDYAFLIRALLDLYEVTFEAKWIAWAAELQDRQDKLFWDGTGGESLQSLHIIVHLYCIPILRNRFCIFCAYLKR